MEHWIKEDYLNSIQLDQYKLVSNFGRSKYNHGGACVYVKKSICTKDVNCLQGLSIEKDFEIAITELVTYSYVIACINRSPNGDFRVYLKNLEFVIQKIQSNKKKKLLLCGDWNINFLIDNKATRIKKPIRKL